MKVRARSRGRKASWKGRGSEPERHFRSVWSADAQAHSSTLESREEGGGKKGERRRAAGWRRDERGGEAG